MRHLFTIFFIVLSACHAAVAQSTLNFDKTLRLDYTLSGSAAGQEISFERASSLQGWAGRRAHLDSLALRGNGDITMSDARTGRVLYRNSFSTLFQEWLATEEATRLRRSFEHVVLLPMPTDSVRIRLCLRGNHSEQLVAYEHVLRPDDILIRPFGRGGEDTPSRYILKSGSPTECIDIAIVAEGYRADEMERFYEKAAEATEALFAHAPFSEMKDRFNVLAIAVPSDDSGVSIPHDGIWRSTALGSHFDTFYSDRYLTTLNLKQLHDLLAPFPYEHIIILANTAEYGGGGIFNSYVLSMTEHPDFRPVVVHEFGHSFAGLADEYFYDDQYEEYYYPDTEPWEQNITTMRDFASKWQDMLPADTPIPTPSTRDNMNVLGVYEGAGYQSKGVYRPSQECRMKINAWPEFCPVCQRAIRRLINFYTH